MVFVNGVIAFAMSASLLTSPNPTKLDQLEQMRIDEHIAVSFMEKVWNIEDGGLAEGATEELLEAAIEAYEILPQNNSHRKDLEVIKSAAESEFKRKKDEEAQEVIQTNTSGYSTHLYGNCRITFYCPGACCCGQWAGGGTASGTRATANRTVANGSLPFGTRLLIDGQEYVVEDRGVGDFQIDIFVNSHEEANRRGLYYSDVYIIDG